MKFCGIHIHAMGPFADQSIDFDALGDARVVSVSGGNGEGKSTMLELLLGGITRKCPTRGPLSGLATARDSFVEVTVENGQRYVIRQDIDAVSAKGQTVITDADGRALVESGKVRDADAFMAAHFPPPEVILNSLFSHQGSAGMLGLSAGDRKKVLLRSIGIERLEGLSAAARERQRDTSTQLDTLVARLADERERGGDVAAIEAELQDVRSSLQAAEARLAEARQALEDARQQKAAYDADQAERGRVLEQRAAIGKRMVQLKESLADCETRIRNNRGLVDRAEEIRGAVERLREIDTGIGAAKSLQQADEREERAAREAAQRSRTEATAAKSRVAAAAERAQRAERRLTDRERIDDAGKSLERLRLAVKAAQEQEIQAETTLEQMRGQRVAGAEERIGGLRDHLQWIIDDNTGAADVLAEQGLDKDDEAVERARTVPAEIDECKKALDGAKDRRAVALRKLADAEQLAARVSDVVAAEQELEAARRDGHEAGEQIGRALSEAEKHASAAREHAAAAAKHAEAHQWALREHEASYRIARDAEPLAKAEARIAELEARATELRTELEKAQTDLAATPEPTAAPSEPAGVAAALSTVEQLDQRTRDAHSRATVLDQRLEAARASAARVEELEGQRAGIAEELADWTRLAADLGRDGLQALEIDAAIPALADICNRLLHEAFGTRFTIDIRTQRLDSKGKRELESMDFIVIDTERGREAPAETLSGGERAIIGEALGLALTALVCARNGVERPTIVRDETSAALDSERSEQYVRMLRRAGEMIGCDRILFVAHNPAMWDLADARIVIGDGSVRVES